MCFLSATCCGMWMDWYYITNKELWLITLAIFQHSLLLLFCSIHSATQL